MVTFGDFYVMFQRENHFILFILSSVKKRAIYPRTDYINKRF
jgi:hypothetical protein